jgi:hypothetical protein
MPRVTAPPPRGLTAAGRARLAALAARMAAVLAVLAEASREDLASYPFAPAAGRPGRRPGLWRCVPVTAAALPPPLPLS